ncbi:MAG: pseudouridine synthase [Candidatus Kapaibacteriota bacterium]
MELKYYVIYKPYQILSQFSPESGKSCLKDFADFPKNVYPVGRLDYDSEGLLIITNDNKLKNILTNPKSNIKKSYYAQVEGISSISQISELEEGVEINLKSGKYITKPAIVEIISTPDVPERQPPIRFRKQIPTTWLSITITEGKNRQIRKMTAAVNLPTLRLIRYSIGKLNLQFLDGKSMVEISKDEIYKLTMGN